MPRIKINHTIETLREHCTIAGNCWLWPNVTHPPEIFHGGRNTTVRRIVRELTDNKRYPSNVRVHGTCGKYNCISPTCSAVGIATAPIELPHPVTYMLQKLTTPATPFTGLGARQA